MAEFTVELSKEDARFLISQIMDELRELSESGELQLSIQPKLLKPPQVAEILDIALTDLQTRIAKDEIPAIRLGPKTTRFDVYVLREWILSQHKDPGALQRLESVGKNGSSG